MLLRRNKQVKIKPQDSTRSVLKIALSAVLPELLSLHSHH